MNTSTIYRLVAGILAETDRDKITALLSRNRIDWNEFVRTASNNYVLQTLYIKFHKHNLTDILPSELGSHLEKVYSLNLIRNQRILIQATHINEVLKAGNITPVFMKGAGNLVDSLYCDAGERIMGDIDILTGPGNMEKAAGLLFAEGYDTHSRFDRTTVGAMKHFPPVYRKGQPAQVDIHRLPVNIQYSHLFDYGEVFSMKRPALENPSFMVMSDAHKIRLSFIHSQLVHWGHQKALPCLRELYDLYLLSAREDPADVYASLNSLRGKAAGYLRVMNATFGIERVLPPSLRHRGKMYLIRHKFSLEKPAAGRIIYKLLRARRLYIEIPVKGLFSKNYRTYMKVRLRNPEWYRRNLGIDRIFGKNN